MKIFLSSTFLDLATARAEIGTWLTGVFGAELIVMETFGSDAAPPDITSVRRVRECDVFVGIYARRYGTIDARSGKSITELELDEAKNAASSGIIRSILLYVLNPGAPWPSTLTESAPELVFKLSRLIERAKQYTVTYFDRTDQLPFFIVRDIYRESAAIRTEKRTLRKVFLPALRTLTRPLGMEFLTSAEAQYLAGRDKQIDELRKLVEANGISLLLGDSGVGKTSLIHAGLIPAVSPNWVTIYTRPLGLPESDIVDQLQTSLFEGRPTYKGPIGPILAESVAVLNGDTLLLVIDQFEDILAARDLRESEQLIEAIRKIRESQLPALRILISYRADLEGRLGESWQRISGSPEGLPRMYVAGIDERSALQVVEQSEADLDVVVTFSEEDRAELKRDLLVASQAANFERVYPPYIQIFIDHIWTTAATRSAQYLMSDYVAAGRIQGIIGAYLGRLLNYAQDSKGEVQAVLVTLVRSYGAKRQVTLRDVAVETGRDETLCENALEKLMDLRLVRHIGEYYEIAHDFIARKVLFELVDTDELTFKRFRELLTSKAAAFAMTRSLLTTEELLMLYSYRDRVIPNELELRLLLSSWLNGKGPALYWLLKSEPNQLAALLQGEESERLDSDANPAMGILLKRRLTGGKLVTADYSQLHGFKLATELAGVISESPLAVPESVLIYGLRHRRAEVRNSASEAVIAQVLVGQVHWIDRLRKSSSTSLRRVYEEIVCSPRVLPGTFKSPHTRGELEFEAVKQLVCCDRKFLRKAYTTLRKLRLRRDSALLGKSLYLCRSDKIATIIADAERVSSRDSDAFLAGIRPPLDDKAVAMLIDKYIEWNAAEGEGTPALAQKANALARAICRVVSSNSISFVRDALKQIKLHWSSRPLVMVILRQANVEDFRMILTRIAASENNVDYWNHTELGHLAEERMSSICHSVPDYLSAAISTAEFWGGMHGVDRKKAKGSDLLPIKNTINRPLYIRLVAYAAVGSAGKPDEQLLTRLVTHPYGLIARAAAGRLVMLFGDAVLPMLSTLIAERMAAGKTGPISDGLVQAEMEYYELLPRTPLSARC